MKNIIRCALTLVLLIPQIAFAEIVTSPPMTISKINVLYNGNFIMYFDQEVAPICTGGGAGANSIFVYPDYALVTTDGLKALLSAALSAHMSGREVNVTYSNGYVQCWGRNIMVN